MKTPLLILLTIVLLPWFQPSMRGQGVSRPGNPPDSLLISHTAQDTSTAGRHDSTKHNASADSLAVRDTLGRMSTPSLVGTLDRSLDSSHVITRNDLQWLDDHYLGTILGYMPGVFVREQSSAGQYSALAMKGQGWRNIAFLENGRPLNDPASGIYNMYQASPEYADRIEVISGLRSFLYGFNSAGGAVNFVTRNYNSNRPFTKLDFFQGPYNETRTDGTFSQNISRKINLTLGFQAQGMDGRFINSLFDSWNIRGKLRYNVSKNLNVIFSEYYTSSETDLNGGANPLLLDSAFALGATVRNPDSYDKITRHDMDFSVVGTLLGDTVNVSTVTLYYSDNLREYRDEENRPAPSPNGIFIQENNHSAWKGVLFTQNLEAAFQRLELGASIEARQIVGSPRLRNRSNVVGAAWGKEEFMIGDRANVSVYGRLDRYLNKTYVGFGGDAALHLTQGISVAGGFSFSRRLPNYMELFWTDSTVTRADGLAAEQHRQVEAGIDVRTPGGLTLHAAYFHRDVVDPILFLPIPSTYVFPAFQITNGGNIATNGIEATARLRMGFLAFEGNGTYMLQREGGTALLDYPKLSLSGGAYFWDTVASGHLDLKAGFRGSYRSAYFGETFNPQALAYVRNAGPELGYASSVDFFLVAHIGDAYIHLVWENLTNSAYFATPYYPGIDRAIRFGVAWEFTN